MLNNLFGSFWILMGALWVWRPGILREWFVRRVGFQWLWFVWAFLIFLALSLVSMAGKIESAGLKKAAFYGIAIVIALSWMAQSQARRKLASWLKTAPLSAFRFFGWLNIATGLSMIFGTH